MHKDVSHVYIHTYTKTHIYSTYIYKHTGSPDKKTGYRDGKSGDVYATEKELRRGIHTYIHTYIHENTHTHI